MLWCIINSLSGQVKKNALKFGGRMPDTSEKSQEKPVYEAPVVVDLNTIQCGEGGTPADCVSGSTPAGLCVLGGLAT